jgi:hypothetical protein
LPGHDVQAANSVGVTGNNNYSPDHTSRVASRSVGEVVSILPKFRLLKFLTATSTGRVRVRESSLKRNSNVVKETTIEICREAFLASPRVKFWNHALELASGDVVKRESRNNDQSKDLALDPKFLILNSENHLTLRDRS